MKNDYSQEQLLDAVRHNIVTFSDFITSLQDGVADPRLIMYIDRLLMNIYLRHLEGKTVSRSQACKLIPADHLDTCKKYVAEAERLGFVAFQNDPKDGRRKNVIPTQGLIDYVEARARATLDTASAILQHKPVQAGVGSLHR
ncbi:hypothetical protein EN828_28405 [Mesorhizobium sp. M2D.F.Ca.ET.185.01.1.1]|uniref:hypothetical protein n=1 Tax=unclassified Mesorhizobium TaxID=325217 RepID=UPI000FCC628E|nr:MULTISPECIES: hypothetical protein [unclassified Mesorhizobium]TGP74305.1 hypothetical protein EN870_28055 [bacterium M00.F.Ca.ET.227.01.1.1]TGT98084.1 hypothetical protein EN806_47955 [bacterium M00.F.Ca.ET.163.01.1.1]TGU33816.1 hypothetical protein EN799_22870 [bacterium M00.F.Ca.ET.156.01.1.1]TGU43431.1 hypothetical protein EN789_28480 [bacterium M00.F.Ca.ET.146.01.1.1]TGV78255.1 hypothetical protein EN792_046265 [Mesorhizobium sp. M00.F.Ca.ET.149.01.1.1]TGW09103.1 hypothetical protein 